MFLSIGRGRLPIPLLLLLFAGFASPAFAVNFNATWDYRQTGGDEMETRSQLQQRYSLAAGKTLALDLQPTHAISASASVSYTRTQRGDDQSTAGTDRLIPSAGLILRNDIFMLQLSGSTNMSNPDWGAASSDSSWDASLLSAWDIPLWPKLRFGYGEQSVFTDRFTISGDADQKVKSGSMSMDWDLILARLAYRYSNSQTEDLIGGGVSESDSHFARFETGRTFWKRLNLSVSQQFQKNNQEVHSGAFREDVVGEPSVKIDDDDPTDDLNYIDPSDVDPHSLPKPVGINETIHLQFATSSRFPERIDTLRLSLDDFAPVASGLQWEVFYRERSPQEGEIVSWIPLTDFQVDQTSIDNTFDIQFDNPIDAAEVLLVTTNSVTPLTFTKLEAFVLLAPEFSSSSTSYLSNLSMSYRILRSLTASGSLTLDHYENESNGAFVGERDSTTVSGGLQWSPSRFVKPSLSFSENRQEQTGQPDLMSRTYSVSVPTYPLPAVRVSLGATRSETFLAERKTAVIDRYSLLARAPIYPDLTAAWMVSYSEVENFLADGSVSAGNSLSSRLDLNAQLYRSLTADLTTSWRRSETSQSSDAKVGMRYRPSDFLSMRGEYSTVFGEDKDQLSLGLDVRALATQKTRVIFGATRIQGDQTSNQFNVLGSWNISRNLEMLSRANYSLAERDVYSFQLRLTLRL
jgi:hypothetical protein